MKNIIHKYLDRNYSLPEAIMLIAAILFLSSFVALFLGKTFQYITGTLFLLIGVYGFIRSFMLKQMKGGIKKNGRNTRRAE